MKQAQNRNRMLLNFFDSDTVDRMTHARKDDTWLARQRENPDVLIVPVWREMNLVEIGTGQAVPVMPTLARMREVDPKLTPEILLGESRGQLYFAVSLEGDHIPEAYAGLGEFRSLRSFREGTSRSQGALTAYANAMIYWHHSHRFCGACGHAAFCAEGGHLRICSNESCKRHHFPRTDPAVIVLVTDESGEHCLLGRAPRWPEGMYSTLAGFVEPGESLELALVREVEEESGVRVLPENVVYHSSQPWPFPASIMLGFNARTHYQEINFDADELEDARWFSRAHIDRELKEGVLRLPSLQSIAYRLINDWREAKK